MDKPTYEAPAIREIGSVHELTLQSFNKIGPEPDTLSAINADVVGSFTPIN